MIIVLAPLVLQYLSKAAATVAATIAATEAATAAAV
jgi:hypothetical protein